MNKLSKNILMAVLLTVNLGIFAGMITISLNDTERFERFEEARVEFKLAK